MKPKFFETLSKTLSWIWLLGWFGYSGISRFIWPDHGFNLALSIHSPSRGHLLGFDEFGRDIQQTLPHAAFTSASFAALAVAVSCVFGLLLGTSIASAPSRSRFIFLRGLEAFIAFPSLLLALAWAAIRGPGWTTLFVSLLIGTLPPLTRLIYARSREILAEPFIEAAKSMGATRSRIFFRYLTPLLGSIFTVKVPVLFAQALVAEATLTFLGVGAPIGHETWGSILASGKEYLFEAPHIAMDAGIPLTLTLLALQVVSKELKSSG